MPFMFFGYTFRFGRFGDDTLIGGDRRDLIFGLWGDDVIVGGDGDDISFGGFGNDRLVDGRGSDFAFGGRGSDVYDFSNIAESLGTLDPTDVDTIVDRGRAGDTDEIDLGSFTVDEVKLLFASGLQAMRSDVDRDGRTDDLFLGGSSLMGSLHVINQFKGDGSGLEQMRISATASPLDDVIVHFRQGLVGTDDNDVIIGFDQPSGSETLEGAGGDDMLFGNGGDDVLIGGPGRDGLYGGDGDDRYEIVLAEEAIGDVPGAATFDLIADLATSAGDTLVFLDVTAAEARMLAAAGFDVTRIDVDGSFDGSAEATDLAFIDTLGILQIVVADQYDGGFGGIETIELADGVLLSVAEDGATGTAGGDLLVGTSGDDTQVGGEGDDFLFGGDGSDLMTGGAGDDVLSDGGGSDTLVGSEGNDIFVLRPDGERDTVFFENDADRIALVGYDNGSGGPLAFDDLTLIELSLTIPGNPPILAGTEIVTPDGDTILLPGIAESEIDPGDFLFF